MHACVVHALHKCWAIPESRHWHAPWYCTCGMHDGPQITPGCFNTAEVHLVPYSKSCNQNVPDRLLWPQTWYHWLLIRLFQLGKYVYIYVLNLKCRRSIYITIVLLEITCSFPSCSFLEAFSSLASASAACSFVICLVCCSSAVWIYWKEIWIIFNITI